MQHRTPSGVCGSAAILGRQLTNSSATMIAGDSISAKAATM